MLSEAGADQTLPGSLILRQLTKLLDSREFSDAERARAFLRFTVDHALRQPHEALKEYTIAVEVLGKDSSFDPKVDPIVRVYAGRVREKLQRYYAGEGARDEILIELRKGSYVPVFSENAGSENGAFVEVAVNKPVLPTRSLRVAAIAGLLFIGCGVASRLLLLRESRPAIAAPVQITFDTGVTAEPALSPDGTLMAYASDRAAELGLDIWLRQAAGGDPFD